MLEVFMFIILFILGVVIIVFFFFFRRNKIMHFPSRFQYTIHTIYINKILYFLMKLFKFIVKK